MNLFEKINFLIRRDGLKSFIFFLFRYLSIKLGNCKLWYWNKRKIRKVTKGKKVIVIAKTIEWNYAFQRTQQLAVNFSKNDDVVVIYITEPVKYDYFFNCKKINESLYCFSYKHYEKLNSILNEASSIILYLTNLNDFDNSLKLNYTKLVYEYIDELSIFFDDLEYGRKLHLEAIKKSDLVVATALRLYDETKEITDKVILSENAGDYDFFSKTKSVKSANEVSNLKNKYDCLIGYYGMLADWFDFDIIKKIAKKNKNWAWVLIGPIYPNFNLEKEELNKYDNIHVLGPKPYNELPSYIKDIDILTIPFKLNDITASTSPVKLFEYMAASKPIITSDMIECRRYESVNIYHSEEELEEIIKKTMTMNQNEVMIYKDKLEKDAKNNTWKHRTDQILSNLDRK